MIQFFGVPLDALMPVLMVVTGVIISSVVVLALFNLLFLKIGLRNITRRRTQMVLIVFALMLSTTLLSSVLATGDVMTAAVQSVAVYNWGNVDETVEGGRGVLNTYSEHAYYALLANSKRSEVISAVGAALREDSLLIADQNSRQVRSDAMVLAVLPGSEKGFGGIQDVVTKHTLTIADLHPYELYINQTTARLLSARVGDMLYLYSKHWPGRRYGMQVAAIVGNNGLIGDNPTLLGSLQTFQDIEAVPGSINIMFIANRSNGGISSADLSDQAADEAQQSLPRGTHVIQVKAQGIEKSLKAGDIFSRIFSLFALFALAIGLLLIFLIFVLLAAERRAEMGMARAIGVQRHHLIWMFLFEGTIYDLLASLVGLLVGLGVGVILIYSLGPILARFNFPLKFSVQPRSLIVAYCLGVIFTFFSVAISSWLVSRMTIAEAMRDLPEPGRSTLSINELRVRARYLRKQAFDSALPQATRLRSLRRLLFGWLPEVMLEGLRIVALTGFLPLFAGMGLLQFGLIESLIIPFSIGLSLTLLGGALLFKWLLGYLLLLIVRLRHQKPDVSWRLWRKVTGGLFAALVGSLLVAYWALPVDVLASWGLSRFSGGIELFFVAGVMMVLGAVWVLMANARLLAFPWLILASHLPGFYAVLKLALAYPLQRRFRTGISVVMFSLVVFAMTVMAVITNAMQHSYVDINTQTGGYDIQATAYFKPLPDLNTSLAQHGINAGKFAAIGVRSTTAVGVLQLSAPQPRWSIYPAQVVSGSFLQGYGLPLVARASGFASDSAIWQALQQHPEYALIDSSALPMNPEAGPLASYGQVAPARVPDFDPDYTFSMSGLYQGDKVFPATPIWVTGLQGHEARKLTIIGIVDNSDSAHYGLYISRTPYSEASLGSGPVVGTPQSQSYYFKVAPGQDMREVARLLGSAYLDNGLETTVLEDAIWQMRGPRILLSNVLLGVVGMTLLLGVAALAITGTRAVIERRQQIGMLRALGCSRQMVQGAFLLEAFLVGALGSVLGSVLGLILARNIFAANFFEQYQTGLTFGVPWEQLGLIVAVALLSSFLGALLPAWQAGKIAPAEALRYS